MGVEVPQADYTRAVRGEPVVPGAAESYIEPLVAGISSCARAAVRRVHQEGVEAARSYFAGKMARHLLQGGGARSTALSYKESFERYIAWDAAASSAEGEAGLDVSLSVAFPCGNAVRAIAHVVPGSEGSARILLWDELPLPGTAAGEMIALPIFECADSVLGVGHTATVDVWQLAHGQQQSVARTAAEGRRQEAARSNVE
jgi:hypothetical protein